jgi:hypothetical protein
MLEITGYFEISFHLEMCDIFFLRFRIAKIAASGFRFDKLTTTFSLYTLSDWRPEGGRYNSKRPHL